MCIKRSPGTNGNMPSTLMSFYNRYLVTVTTVDEDILQPLRLLGQKSIKWNTFL